MTTFSEHRVIRQMSFDADHTAVLVIDMLNDFIDPEGAMPLPGGETLVPPITGILDAARDREAPVVWVCDEHPPNDKEFEKRAAHCLKGSWGARIVAELDPPDDEYRVPKRRYSGFFETDLDLRLRELEMKHVVLVGVVTNICVRSTAHDAFFRGYDVIIPEDGVAATSRREQESSLYDLDTHYATVTDSATVIDGFEHREMIG